MYMFPNSITTYAGQMHRTIREILCVDINLLLRSLFVNFLQDRRTEIDQMLGD